MNCHNGSFLFLIFSYSFRMMSLISIKSENNSNYSEIATVTYLPNHNILTDLNFKFSQEFQDLPNFSYNSVTDLESFPALIYALPSEFGIFDGRMSFTRGRWDSNEWAKPPHDPTSSGFQFHGHFKKHFNSDLSYKFIFIFIKN